MRDEYQLLSERLRLASKVRSLDNKKKNFGFPFVLCSLLRTLTDVELLASLGNKSEKLLFFLCISLAYPYLCTRKRN